jgi:hypothetical protein
MEPLPGRKELDHLLGTGAAEVLCPYTRFQWILQFDD